MRSLSVLIMWHVLENSLVNLEKSPPLDNIVKALEDGIGTRSTFSDYRIAHLVFALWQLHVL